MEAEREEEQGKKVIRFGELKKKEITKKIIKMNIKKTQKTDKWLNVKTNI